MPPRKSTCRSKAKRTPRKSQRSPKRKPRRRRAPEDDFLARWERQRVEERTRGARELQAACDALAALGVVRVSIPYNGYGDSGTVEGPEASDAAEDHVPLPAELSLKLRAAAEWLLPDGWENDAGAFGELILNVAERSCLRAHNWRVESSEYEEETITL